MPREREGPAAALGRVRTRMPSAPRTRVARPMACVRRTGRGRQSPRKPSGRFPGRLDRTNANPAS